MTKWRLIKKFLQANPANAFFALITGLIYNIFTALIPISLGRFYEFNFDMSSYRLKLLNGLPFINTNNFNHFLWFFVSIIFLRFLFEFLNRYFIGILGEKFAKSLREKLFAHQLSIIVPVYEEKGIGKYLLRYSGDLKSIQSYVTQGLFKFTQDVVLIGILLLVIAYYNIGITLIILTFIGIAFLSIFFMNIVLYRISLKRRNQRSGILSYVNRVLQSILTIKIFNKFSPTQLRYNKRSEKLLVVGKQYQGIIALIYGFIPFMIYLMIGIVMFYIYTLKSSQQNIDEASLLVIILLIISFLAIFRRILRVNIIWKLGNISFSKLLNIFSLDAEKLDLQDELTFHEQEIIFNNVIYTTASGRSKHFNFRIPSKKLTFIKKKPGSSDAWVFIKLLLKIYKASEGSISYGIYQDNDLSEKTIRKFISVVSYELSLDGKTVYEAITYSKNTDRKLRAEAILNELQQFEDTDTKICLESKIGEHSVNLTNSQKQILVWCRSLLSNKPILVLHVPFQYLKPKLIYHLMTKLDKLRVNKTIIILDDQIPVGLNIDKNITV